MSYFFVCKCGVQGIFDDFCVLLQFKDFGDFYVYICKDLGFWWLQVFYQLFVDCLIGWEFQCFEVFFYMDILELVRFWWLGFLLVCVLEEVNKLYILFGKVLIYWVNMLVILNGNCVFFFKQQNNVNQ